MLTRLVRSFSTRATSSTGRLSIAPSTSPTHLIVSPVGSSSSPVKLHAFWLRDHCKCSECWHPVTKQRLHDTFAIPTTIGITGWTMKSTNKESVIQVTFSDGHQGEFDQTWLEKQLKPTTERKRKKVLWGSEFELPKVAYESVMKGDDGLAEWLEKTDIYGVCMVQGVPATPEATEQLAQRIAFIRESHFGKFWDFTSNMQHGDTAYTNLAIGAHTDTTYFTDPVGLQLFHLLHHKNGTGGHTLLVDGFSVASHLKSTYPDAFRVLSSTPVATHCAGDTDTFIRPSVVKPIISVDPTSSDFLQIRYNNHDRSTIRHASDSDMVQFYDALTKWHTILTRSDMEKWIKMEPGCAVLVDNWRVLHGRSAFTGNRRLCGAYINWDDYQSRVAMLVDKGKDKELL